MLNLYRMELRVVVLLLLYKFVHCMCVMNVTDEKLQSGPDCHKYLLVDL